MRFFSKQYSDQDILEGIQAGGSDEHLAYLYREMKPKIRAWVIKNQGTEEEAQDIFQDCVVALYQKVVARDYPAEKPIKAYLFTAAKNKWKDRAKERARYRSDELPERIAEEERTEQGGGERRTDVLLEGLGTSCQEILRLSIFYRMSMEDIAQRMGLANANVAKTKAYKCKQRLVKMVRDRAGLKKYLYDEA